MSYSDNTYFRRVNYYGKTVADVATDMGIRSFQRWLAQSPNVPKNDLTVQGRKNYFFRGIILQNKDKEHKKIMQLCVSLDTQVKVGDIINWDDEKWILYRKERKARQTFQSFYMIRCNYLLKWVDGQGHLQQTWCHFTSSLDSKIKENFRTWNSLISPQVNKYAEIIMPYHDFLRHTRFIIDDQGWILVEIDKSSVKGITYLSLSEQKVNMINDSLEEDIADLDKMAQYTIDYSNDTKVYNIWQEIQPTFTIMKNGTPIQAKVVYSFDDKQLLQWKDKQNNIIETKGFGSTYVIATLANEPYTSFKIPIQIGGTLNNPIYIQGNDTIRLDRTSTYQLVSDDQLTKTATFSISNENLATIISSDKTSCVIKANANNKLGSVLLSITYNNKIYSKQINIISLW